jgi:hypothetical protein
VSPSVTPSVTKSVSSTTTRSVTPTTSVSAFPDGGDYPAGQYCLPAPASRRCPLGFDLGTR